jgi:hypothetical protein
MSLVLTGPICAAGVTSSGADVAAFRAGLAGSGARLQGGVAITHTTLAGKNIALATLKRPPLTPKDKRMLRRRGWLEQSSMGQTYFCQDRSGSGTRLSEQACFTVQDETILKAAD